MHGFTQGVITGISGGDFYQGFWAGSISSVVSSVTGGLNNATGLSGTAGDVSTMFFGTVSGGLSSEFTGGNFWQGAATGLTVSGLNHVAHKITYRNFVRERLEAIGLNWKDRPNFSVAEIDYLLDYDPTLNSMYEYADRPAIEIDPNQTAPGSTPISIKSIKAKTVGTMTFGTKAFRSYYTLYQSVGHELRHAYQIVSGIYANSLKINGGNLNKAIYSMEIDALWWNYSQNMNDLQFLKLASGYEKKLNLNLSK